jgi:hypothetical protein
VPRRAVSEGFTLTGAVSLDAGDGRWGVGDMSSVGIEIGTQRFLGQGLLQSGESQTEGSWRNSAYMPSREIPSSWRDVTAIDFLKIEKKKDDNTKTKDQKRQKLSKRTSEMHTCIVSESQKGMLEFCC